ncbi:DNA-binding transcriptional regulator, PucR family [Marinobacter daqiaonensis]|uniref:DNA-binding transcriptional regulator, PucR family n=1 Tax=Marinobacter daqiaonensis TaxID=650891 RepID=A0A1I6H0V9_9GAMM|nr:helix-turn-helix domain-containing protein [Marinobacter daqiaonensis]SFR48093.1 DNA-binding transcriptional regulator, PucR family [Marinobacter daqiaonensis]
MTTGSPTRSEALSNDVPRSVLDLLRRGAEQVLSSPVEWLSEIDNASMTVDVPGAMAEDPVLAAATRRANRGSLTHWALANVEKPGAPVAPYISEDMKSNARELVRLGVPELMFSAARAAQNAAWNLWMKVAFELTDDPAQLRQLLELSSRSVNGFVEANMEGITAIMRDEREKLIRSGQVDRRELITRVLEGDLTSVPRLNIQLKYAVDQPQLAAIVWCEDPNVEISRLEGVSRTFARCAGTSEVLTVAANSATLWVWCHATAPLDLPQMEQYLSNLSGVYVTVGSEGTGLDGFRRSHLEAATTQRVFGRLRPKSRIVVFDQIRLVSLMSEDPEATRQFVSHTLGDLASAGVELQQALLTYLSHGCNAAQATKRLHTHRNTLLRRLARAEELLPRPLAENRIHVAAALELLTWSNGQKRIPGG